MVSACSRSSPEVIRNGTSITSPFFPEHYANNQECKWLIEAPKDKIIQFWLTQFDLAQPGDYLEIRDGMNDTNDLIRNISTEPDLSERWSSTGRYLLVKFKSDKSIVAKGFTLAYTTVKGGMRHQCYSIYLMEWSKANTLSANKREGLS